MKRTSFACLLFLTASFFLTSCNNDASDEKTTDDTTSTNTSNTTSAPVNTIVTTPESMMVAVHKVADFDKWLASYEAHDSLRVANGLRSYVVGRGVDDPNTVLVAVKANDGKKAQAFSKDPNLKAAMQKGGVTSTPTFYHNISEWQDTAQISTTLRSMSTFTVKDWDAWFKSFQEGKQERIDNGIVDRVVSHDMDDNKKVSLVTAITDTAKAHAYWKSDMLKQRRAAGGVIGEPKRFVFNIAKRY
ncbi:MAG: hypothetical protein H7Y42_04190 [Chitinophagaceae bacterium]|nr:hypothetical protein [Chitinophagaceae bacterium]